MADVQCPRCDTVVAAGTTQCPSCGLLFESEPTVAYVELPDPEHPLTPDEAASVDGISGWALVVEKGPRTGMTFVLNEGTTAVGRQSRFRASTASSPSPPMSSQSKTSDPQTGPTSTRPGWITPISTPETR